MERVDGFPVEGFEGEVEVLGGLPFDDGEGGAGAADLGATVVALDGVRDGRADGFVEATRGFEVAAAEPEVVNDARLSAGAVVDGFDAVAGGSMMNAPY